MHRRTAAVLLAAFLIAALPVDALEAWRLVVRVSGRVESRQQGQENFSPIWRSRILTDGDLARTGKDSRASIKLADQSEFTIGADTTVEMTKFALTPEGRTVVFNLQVGKVRARVARLLGRQSRFEVHTPNGVLAARGTDFYVEQQAGAQTGSSGLLAHAGGPVALDAPGGGPAGNTIVRVFQGRVLARTPLGTQIFRAGDSGVLGTNGTIRFNPGGLPGPTTHGPAGGTDNGGDSASGTPDVDLASGGTPSGGGGDASSSGASGNAYSDSASTGTTSSESCVNESSSSSNATTDSTSSSSSSGSTTPPVYTPGSTTKTGSIPIVIK